MKKYLLLIALNVAFCICAPAQLLCIHCYDQNDSLSDNVTNLLLNGGFEIGTCTSYPDAGSYYCPNSSLYSCDITDWTCTGGGTGTYACQGDTTISWGRIVEGVKIAYFGNAFNNTCSAIPGDTSCLLSEQCTVTGIPSGYPYNDITLGGTTGVSLEQTATGLIPGNTYVLEFWTGGEAGSFVEDGLFALDVGFGKSFLRNHPTPPLTGIGNRFIVEFIATSSSHTIKFTNWGHICSNCTELILDDVRLYTLAELDASVPHCTTGIDNPNSQNPEYIVSPNPFANELTVKSNNNELSEIILYDIASKKLMEKTFVHSVSLNTEQLSEGIYFYELKTKDGVVEKGKVVK